MLTLKLEGFFGDSVVVGPAPFFLCEGSTLCAGPDLEPVATHSGGAWETDFASYITVALPHPVRVRFECPATQRRLQLGPWKEMRFVDGSLRGGEDGKQIVARFDDASQQWAMANSAVSMPNVVIEPA